MAAAAQFSPVNTAMQMQQHPQQQQQQYSFVSSNAYYGYVPLPRATTSSAAQSFDNIIVSDDTHMLVDDIVPVGVDEHQQRLCRKRGSDRCGADLAGSFCLVQPKLKRFCTGEQCFWSEGYGLAKMYNEPSLLRLSPAAADSKMSCRTSPGKNINFHSRSSIGVRSQELEDMLLLTHGCSSYHHYRHTQLSLNNDIMEAEF